MTYTGFRRILLQWYRDNARDLPWVNEKDPYKVWLCEVIMQQTQVQQGIAYYRKFVAEFPTVQHLAKAPENKVLKMWEGLGYYSRARNLHYAANIIVSDYGGKFPDNYADLIQLKGVGPYMAAAILSFAWNKPFMVADANVNRIIARFFGVEAIARTPDFNSQVNQHLAKCFDSGQPAVFNQAMMDFGSVVCKAKNPDCHVCPMASSCFAHKHAMQNALPALAKKIKRRQRYFNYLVFTQNEKTIIEQRMQQDIWKNLFQFPMIETDGKQPWKTLRSEIAANLQIKNLPEPYLVVEPRPQQLTHQEIHAVFYNITVKDLKPICKEGMQIVRNSDLKKYAFPGIIRNYFNELK